MRFERREYSKIRLRLRLLLGRWKAYSTSHTSQLDSGGGEVAKGREGRKKRGRSDSRTKILATVLWSVIVEKVEMNW